MKLYRVADILNVGTVSFIRFLRRAVRFPDKLLALLDKETNPVKIPPLDRYDEIARFIRSLDVGDESARTYLETHLRRIARTLTLVPQPCRAGRALELGAYMQMTPALSRLFGYNEVRGAYYGPLGRVDKKSVTAGGKQIFECEVDHFDAEKDVFPYPDNHFEVVLACEIIEHLLHDPMQMLVEIRRVLDDGGHLVLTTPNIVSFTAVARVLHGHENPQLFSMYTNPNNPYKDSETPHVREYTPTELATAVQSAGYEIDYLFTEKIAGYEADLYYRDILELNHYPTNLRGEQMYCLAHKVAGAPITRYPSFLYHGC
jgi:SAM-dependent methyltransferase